MNFRAENLVLLHAPLVAEPGQAVPPATPEQARCEPETLHRHPERPSRFSPSTPIRLNRPARIVAAKVAGETIVVGPVIAPTEQADDPRHQERPSRDGLRLSDAESIRRGMEREAMEFAVELMHTSKAFHSMVCNRLEVICHEDLDTLAAPHVFPFVAASLAASRDRYSKSIGEARLMVGNCDPHDVPVAEVPRWLSLRCGHRAAVHA